MHLRMVSITRWLGLDSSKDNQTCQLHYFVDASQLAYGAVSYLRVGDYAGNTSCSLVMSKSYLVPKNEISIPRLELLGAVTAVKMDCMLRKELHMQLRPSVFWTDSLIVLHNLTNERKRFPPFVSRRLALITKATNVNSWNYVPTSLNPADLLPRGARADIVVIIVKGNVWFTGPEYLTQSPSKWAGRFKKNELSPEEVKLFDKARVDCFSSCVVDNTTSLVDKLIIYFSSWYKLKKATVWILKFKAYVMSCRSKDIRLDKKLTVDDLRAAESALIMYAQRQCFGDVIQRMPNKEPISKQSSVMKLDPIVIDGIMRVGGRLDRAPVGFEARHPIILAHVSHLIISHFHVLTGHGGIGLTMNSLFQRFWIMKATSAIRRVITNCTHCRLRYAKPNQQLMTNLPQDRL